MRIQFHSLALIFFVLFHGLALRAQTPSISINDLGLQFADGNRQSTTFRSPNPGNQELVLVAAEFSNGIVGDISQAGYDNHVLILKLHHEMYRPLNAAGIPSETQHHRSFLLRKDVDRASPDLYTAFRENATINQVIIKYIRFDSSMGTNVEFFNITLDNVKIAEYNTDMDYDSQTTGFYPSETLRIVYQNITFANLVNNESAALPYVY